MKIKIVKDDIDFSTRRSLYYCPIANAVKRRFPGKSVRVFLTDVCIENNSWFNLSQTAQSFIRAFDSGHDVKPQTIDILKRKAKR